MKKTLLILTALFTAMSVITACGNAEKPQDTTEMSLSSGSVTEEEKGDEIMKCSGTIKYSPKNYNMWDSWCAVRDGTAYLIHLKGLKGTQSYQTEEENRRGFGFAVSGDLVHWEQKADILKASDSTNDMDYDFRYTGCAVVDKDRLYVYYTMRKWGGQRIGVAYSDDMVNFTEYSGNPVLVPDSSLFIGFAGDKPSDPSWWSVDCRDFLVIPDPDGGWLGYFVAAASGDYTTPTAVVGIARSEDLLHWEQIGIVYRPTGVSMPEMIDVFEINGKWYMTLTSGKNNGGINMFSDPYISRAQMYAVSDSPFGPFTENAEDNVVFGGQYDSGYSSRTLLFAGKRRMMYTDSNTGDSVLSFPKDVGVDEKGHLRTYYAEDLMSNVLLGALSRQVISQPTTSFAWNTKGGKWRYTDSEMTIRCDENSWQSAVFEGVSRNLMLTYTLAAESSCSSFGIVLTDAEEPKLLSDLNSILVLDRENDRVYLTDNTWELRNARQYSFEEGKAYEVRMVLAGDTLELFINDEFVFNSGIVNTGRNHAGIFANDGSFKATDIEYRKIEN